MAERLFHPGTGLVVLGAVLVYASAPLSALLLRQTDRGSIWLKTAGVAVAAAGAFWLLAAG